MSNRAQHRFPTWPLYVRKESLLRAALPLMQELQKDGQKVDASRFRLTPRENSDLKIKSRDTDGSPASILASLDWLVCSLAARACWVNFRCLRVALSSRLAASRVSMRSISALES
jgi:hypothetical protein